MKNLLLTLLVILLLFSSIAEAGEWTFVSTIETKKFVSTIETKKDEFDDEDQTTKTWTPLFGDWTFMDGIYKMVMGTGCGAAITDFDLTDAESIETKARYGASGWENVHKLSRASLTKLRFSIPL